MKTTRRTPRKPRPPQRSEIGRIKYETTTMEVEEPGWRGQPKKVQKPAIHFWVEAVGPKGIYTAKISKPFLAVPESKTMSRYRSEAFVPYSKTGRDIIDTFLSDLWNDGWQPISFGQYWYDFTLRRVVPEPVEAAQASTAAAGQAPAAQDGAGAAAAAATMATPAPAPVPATPPDPFQSAEAAYTRLRVDYAAGRLNPDQFRTAVEGLRFQDPQRRNWMIDGKTSRWIAWDGKTWTWATPPGRADDTVQRGSPSGANAAS